MALLSSLESVHTGTLDEIDRRLRERKILIQGYRIDPIIGYIAVKIDVLREIRPPDELKTIADEGTRPLLEDVFGGLPGYIVVTDSQLKIEDMSYKGEWDDKSISIQCSMNIEHTYVMKDGKYLCEWGDPLNPLHNFEPLFEKREVKRTIEQKDGIPTIRYEL
jgi:hypothetical protein